LVFEKGQGGENSKSNISGNYIRESDEEKVQHKGGLSACHPLFDGITRKGISATSRGGHEISAHIRYYRTRKRKEFSKRGGSI
jgi:hypothetical protein